MTLEAGFRSIIEGAVVKAAEKADEAKVIEAIKSGAFGEAVVSVVPEIGASMANTLVETMPWMLAERRGSEATIAESLHRSYGPGLDVVEAILRCVQEIGEEYVDLRFPKSGEIPVMRWVLGHLHARACRIAEEALVLLKAGYGLGAYSRWRALHEVVVVGQFINQHGEETAARYYEHIDVNRWRLLKEGADAGRLDEESLAALKAADARVDELTEKYGEEFRADYGWAVKALAGQPNGGFRGIEGATDFTHLRVDYREASSAIHAVAHWVLDPPDADLLGTTMVTGASPLVVATPAHAVAISLLGSIGTLLMSTESWASPFLLETISVLCDRAGELLVASEAEVERKLREEQEEAAAGG